MSYQNQGTDRKQRHQYRAEHIRDMSSSLNLAKCCCMLLSIHSRRQKSKVPINANCGSTTLHVVRASIILSPYFAEALKHPVTSMLKTGHMLSAEWF